MSTKTPKSKSRFHDSEYFAEKLIDWVATTTQLDPDKGELPNIEDWKRCAKTLFDQAIDLGRKEMKAECMQACNDVATGSGDRHQPVLHRVYVHINKLPEHKE